MLSVLGPEEKTVARIVVEGPTTVRDGAPVGLRVRIEALRGYDKDAAKVCRTLDAIPGFGPAKEPLFESVLRAAGLHPRSFRSKPDLEFIPRIPVTQAFAGTLTLRATREGVFLLGAGGAQGRTSFDTALPLVPNPL